MGSILVVDDEQKIQNVYKNLFERNGHAVTTASDCARARDLLKQGKFDLILLDINMGGIQGDILYEIAKCFHQNTKIIVSSVYPVEEQQSLMPDADDYFDKSEGNRVLLEKVRRVLEKEELDKGGRYA